MNEFYTYPNFKDNPDKLLNYDVFSKSTENVKHHIVNFDKEASILYKELYSSKNFDELYYSRKYFYHMLKNVAQRHNKKKNMKTNDLYNILKEYNLLNAVKRDAEKIVNLEAFPFRSKTPGKFGKEIVKLESDVILFSARIINWRIILTETQNGEKPIFIFRRFDDFWKPLIENVLKKDFKIEKTADVNSVLNYFHKKYFFTNYKKNHKNVSRYVTENTLYRNDKKITKQEFNNLINKVFCKGTK